MTDFERQVRDAFHDTGQHIRVDVPRLVLDSFGDESGETFSIREMKPSDAVIRINYFHDSSDQHLRRLGVDRDLLPTRNDWHDFLEEDGRRPIHHRRNYALVWELDGQPVGFSSADRITFGKEAFLHLHILRPDQRRTGLGVEFLKRSAAIYFDVLQLDRLFSEPNAFNTAPNRALQRAGFRYLFTHVTVPGPL